MDNDHKWPDPAVSMFQQIHERWLKNHQTKRFCLVFAFDPLTSRCFSETSISLQGLIVVDRRRLDCYEWKDLRIILRGHLRSRWPYRLQIVRLLFLSLRNLLGAGGVVLLLLSGLRLYLFLRRVLVRGFRRFVPHDSKGKVHDNWRQAGSGGALVICDLLDPWFVTILMIGNVAPSWSTTSVATDSAERVI